VGWNFSGDRSFYGLRKRRSLHRSLARREGTVS
jgi:hypothetical protein